MELDQELQQISEQMDSLSLKGEDEIYNPLRSLEKEANEVGRSFSGSWLGYHAFVYYSQLTSPPPGAHFSQEWGLQGDAFLGLGSRGDWQEYDPSLIRKHILHNAKLNTTEDLQKSAEAVAEKFKVLKSDASSILSGYLDEKKDSFLVSLKDELEKLELPTANDVIKYWSPKGQIITRDPIAVGQGTRIPPHIKVLAEVAAIRGVFIACSSASKAAKKAASHLERKLKQDRKVDRIGTNIFIGHGRSGLWRELKDFVQDRLHLPCDEFNRVPVAGVTNISRLSEMLDAAAVAFIVMTAEDETADGEFQARMNVVHEAGLFQGRLGFTRAIVLLEEGCKEFSNIQGLGQIRFPNGNISAAFEEIRQVLEREDVIKEK